MNSIKASSLILLLAIASMATSAAADTNKPNRGFQKLRQMRLEQHQERIQEQAAPRQIKSSQPQEPKPNFALEKAKKNLTPIALHRRFKRGHGPN